MYKCSLLYFSKVKTCGSKFQAGCRNSARAGEMLDCPLLGDGLSEGTDAPLKRMGEYSFEWGPQPKLETASAEAQAGVP